MKETRKSEYQQLDLLDFGVNESGEYVNLVEEKKQKEDISEKALKDFITNHHDPLIRIADSFFCGYEYDGHYYKDVQTKLEKIATTKCFHYGNLKEGIYIFSLYDESEDRYILVFENKNHYLGFGCDGFYFDKDNNYIHYSLDDYLTGKAKISFPALYCPIFDLNGIRQQQYCDDPYQNDIRHIVCIKEWHMDKYSVNRIQEGKKIKDFYECEFALPDLIKHWGYML